jgi:2-C-methyl-D-erythritol 4-phosphate cytidylyltransferase
VTGSVVAVIPAAGLGTRLAPAGEVTSPKAARLLHGQSLLRRSAELLAPYVDLIVVAAHTGHTAAVGQELADLQTRFDVVAGGPTRQQSVSLALARVPADIDFVLVHDAARPLVPASVVERVLDALRAGAVAVVPVVPVVDTLRRTDDDGSNAPLDRSSVRAVQTPQGFSRAELVAAHHSSPADDATDDAGLVEALGHRVTLVDGDPLGFKITRPSDILLAEAILAADDGQT